MTYFHVRLSVGEQHDEVKCDLDLDGLETQILRHYRAGEPITINGRSIPASKLQRVKVSKSDEPSTLIIERLRTADRNSSAIVIGGPTMAWRAAANATDVTDEFITGPPGSGEAGLVSTGSRDDVAGLTSLAPTDANSVFVVAGRDSVAVSAVVAVLRALGLRIVEWEHAVARTGLPNPFVGDVVATGLAMAAAAVVVMTPDDVVTLRSDLLRDDDGSDERELRGQARPNVYYEAGIADTIGRERTVIIEMGSVKSFSDAAGRHVVRYDGSAAKRNALAERLRIAGLDVDTSGEDWLLVGDLDDWAPVLGDVRGGAAGRDVIEKSEVRATVDVLLNEYERLARKSQYDDLSDLEDECLELVIRAQAFFDGIAANTSYADEVQRAKAREVHERVVVVAAALRAIRADL